jgi:hypothetical protein
LWSIFLRIFAHFFEEILILSKPKIEAARLSISAVGARASFSTRFGHRLLQRDVSECFLHFLSLFIAGTADVFSPNAGCRAAASE